MNGVLAPLSMIPYKDHTRHQVFEIPQERSGKLCRFDHNTSGLRRVYGTGGREKTCRPRVAAN